MVGAFSQPGTEPNKMEGYPPIPMFSVGLLIEKRPFQDWAMPG